MIEFVTQNYNTNVTQPDDPVKEGYSFAGWYRDIDYTLEYTFTIDSAFRFALLLCW